MFGAMARAMIASALLLSQFAQEPHDFAHALIGGSRDYLVASWGTRNHAFKLAIDTASVRRALTSLGLSSPGDADPRVPLDDRVIRANEKTICSSDSHGDCHYPSDDVYFLVRCARMMDDGTVEALVALSFNQAHGQHMRIAHMDSHVVMKAGSGRWVVESTRIGRRT